jgi:hypothetical protein
MQLFVGWFLSLFQVEKLGTPPHPASLGAQAGRWLALLTGAIFFILIK